jgi:tellurite resistance protein
MTRTTTVRERGPLLSLTPAQALMSVAVMAAYADGRVRARELQRLRLMAQEHPLFARVDSVDGFIAERVEDLRAFGRASLLNDCRAALSPRLRETAYAWAARVVQEDGSQHPGEHAFLKELGASFGVPGPLAAKIRAVAAVLRRTR